MYKTGPQDPPKGLKKECNIVCGQRQSRSHADGRVTARAVKCCADTLIAFNLETRLRPNEISDHTVVLKPLYLIDIII